MPPVKFSRYEFADVHEDEEGRLFLDFPEPVSRRRRGDDQSYVIGQGEDLWSVAWRQFRDSLDPQIDLRPSGFWWVVAELNDVVDPINEPPDLGARLRAPSLETLFSRILTPPQFFSNNFQS